MLYCLVRASQDTVQGQAEAPESTLSPRPAFAPFGPRCGLGLAHPGAAPPLVLCQLGRGLPGPLETSGEESLATTLGPGRVYGETFLCMCCACERVCESVCVLELGRTWTDQAAGRMGPRRGCKRLASWTWPLPAASLPAALWTSTPQLRMGLGHPSQYFSEDAEATGTDAARQGLSPEPSFTREARGQVGVALGWSISALRWSSLRPAGPWH